VRRPGWVVVVPVKRLAEAKTRLHPPGPAPMRQRLALAMAQDTVRAVLACPEVSELVVVTDDPRAAPALVAMGAQVVPDQPAAGLNPAVTYAARTVAGRPALAAVTADLPALRPAELGDALRAVAGGRAFVADAAGTGTTLVAAPPGVELDPRFGDRSAARHAASGARPLTGDWPTLRCDVDTVGDLAAAAELGLGPYTSAVWHSALR
jgi:2-phospho-L-lactate/phosphoenolpyruvate guanylyltransferase